MNWHPIFFNVTPSHFPMTQWWQLNCLPLVREEISTELKSGGVAHDSSITREWKPKPHYSKNTGENKCWQRYREIRKSVLLMECVPADSVEISWVVPQKDKHRVIIWAISSTPVCVHERETSLYFLLKPTVPVFIGGLLIIANKTKQITCPPTR